MVIYPAIFFLGAAIASFLNVVAKSLPANQNWWSRRSASPCCQTVLQPTALIPIISYLVQNGRCKACLAKIPPSYFWVELTGGLLFLTPLLLPRPYLLQSWLFIALLMTVTLTDFYYRLVPNKILIAFGVPLFLLQPQLAGAVTGFLFFYGAALIGHLLWKKPTIGGGDIKLYFVIGLILPIRPLLLSVVIASGLALCYILIFSQNKKQEIPFVPFIAAGSLLSYLLMYF